ncbi:MAG TPA: class II fructose-bisphosphate aldolase [Ardenticatenaceae bacterium]|jgi:fructose/tagatose bisphosphate aldolase
MQGSSNGAWERRLEGILQINGDNVTVTDEAGLRGQMDQLVRDAVFGEGLDREMARWLIWEAGQALGIYASSIHELYLAIGRGDVPSNFTVPAMNLRGMTYNTARAAFRAATRLNASALIFEIARSEIGYTDQRPAEYVSSVIAAAIREGFRGPLFIQGDHFQVSLKAYGSGPDKELQAVKDLMREAIDAGFYNIDIDTSTLVDLDKGPLDEQQRNNYEICAQLTEYVREIEPQGVTVSLGGEIGEVGGHNSTVEELHAFMQGYRRTLANYHPNIQGISKISVQTGTSHGGVVLPDGTLAEVQVDFETLGELGRIAREQYVLGGAVQHGASTLPPTAFNRFPEVGTVEIHLATGFQSIMFQHAPQEIVNATDDYCRTNFAKERKADQTEEQFLYGTRKKSLGPLKRQWWDLDEATQTQIGSALEEQFAFLFDKLNVKETRDYVARTVTALPVHRPRPQSAVQEQELEIASDLAD